MIARVWKGWTSKGNADAYERLLEETILPSFNEIEDYKGGLIYRAVEVQGEVEFMVTNYFTSIESIKAFSSHEDYTVAEIEPEARELLSRNDNHATHYEIKEAFQLDTVFNSA